MDRLDWSDMNSLNAIAGALRLHGGTLAADTLRHIQQKATIMIMELEQSDCQGADKMQYVKTVNVTNTKNVLVQVPGWVVKRWGLDVGNTLEVNYDAEKEEIRIRRPAVEHLRGRSGSTQGHN